MDEIKVRDLSAENVEDLFRICVPIAKRDDSAYVTGLRLNMASVAEVLDKLQARASSSSWAARRKVKNGGL